MNRIKGRIQVALVTSSTTTGRIVLNSGAWFALEVPDADKAKAITIQTPSGDDPTTWLDVVTLEDVTNRFKGLTTAELAIIGCLAEIRLKFASAPAATSNAYIHWCS